MAPLLPKGIDAHEQRETAICPGSRPTDAAAESGTSAVSGKLRAKRRYDHLPPYRIHPLKEIADIPFQLATHENRETEQRQ